MAFRSDLSEVEGKNVKPILIIRDTVFDMFGLLLSAPFEIRVLEYV